MRPILGLLLLPVLTLPAWAADPSKEDAAPAHHARVTWEEHFTQANVAHDGHLTPEEAKVGYALIAKHFDDIDVDHKGYVTENDIRAWRIMRKAAHRLTQPPENVLRPRNAMQFGPVAHKPISASTTRTVTMPADPPAAESNEAN